MSHPEMATPPLSTLHTIDSFVFSGVTVPANNQSNLDVIQAKYIKIVELQHRQQSALRHFDSISH